MHLKKFTHFLWVSSLVEYRFSFKETIFRLLFCIPCVLCLHVCLYHVRLGIGVIYGYELPKVLGVKPGPCRKFLPAGSSLRSQLDFQSLSLCFSALLQYPILILIRIFSL